MPQGSDRAASRHASRAAGSLRLDSTAVETVAPSVSAQVAAAQADGQELATRLEALPIEYDQALAGTGEDTIQGGTLDALDGIQRDTIRTMDRAPWIQAAERAKVLDAIAATSQAARDRATSPAFLAAVTAAAAEVRTAFGRS